MLNKEEIDSLNEYIRIAIALTDEEYSCFIGQKKPTLDMYNNLCQKLYDLNCEKNFFKFLSEYPDLMEQAANQILREIEQEDAEY